MSRKMTVSIPHWIRLPRTLFFCLLLTPVQSLAEESHRKAFNDAWQSARSGDRSEFRALESTLKDYELYPYWQYEDYRQRRHSAPPDEVAAFLESHSDWAFAGALRTAWLKALGERRRWEPLLQYSGEESNTEVRCYQARARLATKQTEGLLADAQSLWAVGQSQPDACDPLFAWMKKQGGITTALAWQRIEAAMQAGNPRFTLYLARYLPAADRGLLEQWQRMNRERYRNLKRARHWRSTDRAARIAALSVKRLAHYDASAAHEAFEELDGHFSWSADTRGDARREIALMAAVELNPAGLEYLTLVPETHRNEQLLEWWTRWALSQRNWPEVLHAIGQMAPETADDSRWRYWKARALDESGEHDQAIAQMYELSGQANFHGFLAADQLGQPYSICPLEPDVTPEQVDALAQQADFSRALELKAVELDNWALAEWSGATRRLPVEKLRIAAALAREQGWQDRAIFALGNSGELQFYEWRFPVLFASEVESEAARHDLDPAWVFGIMRSESAMTETARSSAGALGLMQVTPDTAKKISRTHGLPYRSSKQLLDGPVNIRFGTVYLRELLDDYGQNPILVSGAYNAGPNAVERWLRTRPLNEPAIWVETLPYYETRDYIPRVLAFTAIYDWRLGKPVRRVSSRMPAIDSGTMARTSTTEVVCQASNPALAATQP